MKKLLFCVLFIALAMPVFAIAETSTFEAFSVELPKGYTTVSDNDPEYREYENEDSWDSARITISLVNSAYSAEDVAQSYSDGSYSVKDYNGVSIALWADEITEDSLGASFVAGNHIYMISYEILGFLSDDNYKEWESILNSITITANTEIDEELEAAAADYTTLEKGSKGEEVKALQQRLIDLLYLSGNADGDYGNKTKAAVEGFQKAAGILPATGIADGVTQAKLFADDAPEAQMSVSCSVAGINNYSTAYWNVNGQEFTLKNNQTKTLDTPWGKYKFDAHGDYEKLD